MVKLHRFLISESLPPADEWVALEEPTLLHQLQSVLRVHTGEVIILFNERQEARVLVDQLTADRLVGQVQHITQRTDSFLATTLYCTILKSDNFEWVVQKATEIGVQRIVPLLTERVIKQQVRLDRLQRIAREAVEQCGRMSLPQIDQPQQLAAAIQTVHNSSKTGWWLTQQGQPVHSQTSRVVEAAVFVGPEGGWSPEEEAAATAIMTPISLGDTVLRAETAAVIGSYLAVNRPAL